MKLIEENGWKPDYYSEWTVQALIRRLAAAERDRDDARRCANAAMKECDELREAIRKSGYRSINTPGGLILIPREEQNAAPGTGGTTGGTT
jgi:hypothetical protein